MKPLVSIIVPIYNGEKYIDACVEYLLAQTYSNLEILLVDDGSKDRSGEICDTYAEKYEQIKVIHQKNGGVSTARNAGIRQAQGKYIAFVDADDYLEKDAVADNVKLAEEHQADVTMFCFWYYNVDKQKKIPNPLEEGFVGNGEEFFHRFLIKTIDKEVFHAPWNKLIKRQLLADNQIEFDTRYCIYEDACFVAELLSKAQKIVVNKEMYYQYNVRSAGTLITSFRENFFESVTQLYRNAMAYCAQYRDNEPQVERFSRMYTGLVIMHLKQISCRKELGREDRKRLIDKICGSAEFMEALDKSGIRGRKRLICMLLRKRRYRTMVFLYRVLNKLQGN